MRKIAPYSFIITFVWFGFVCAISFMEAPVKFSAPLLTREAGLDTGRIVFAALNKVEIAFSLLSIVFLYSGRFNNRIKFIFLFILIILSFQSIWLLPALNERALIIIGGKTPPDSGLHFIYIILEIIKVIGLFLLGLLQINHFRSVSPKEDMNKNAPAR